MRPSTDKNFDQPKWTDNRKKSGHRKNKKSKKIQVDVYLAKLGKKNTLVHRFMI